MEQESFSGSQRSPELMNRFFVSIKVDREERPDIDRVYITFLDSLFTEPDIPQPFFSRHDLKPFFGGTYFPKEAGNGLPAFREVLTEISKRGPTIVTM